MRIYEHFPYTGTKDRWVVPEGVTSALFECWGAAGGMPSTFAWEGKKRQVVGGTAAKNNVFYNAPNSQGQLGKSFANGSGYARGTRSVTEGQTFWVFVGGNGDPGHSTIKLKDDGTDEVTLRGGNGGWNGGGNGGDGAKVTQNLYDSTSTKYHYHGSSLPIAAKNGQLWMDTSGSKNTLKKCNTTYTKGNAANSKWDVVTHDHGPGVGPSGGGGGGATDIRINGTDTNNRILIAGGGGGAGGHYATTGKAAWTLRVVPANPSPPFGSDSDASGATGPDSTWTTSINYLVGGWGLGGLGGGSGPTPSGKTTSDGGICTEGGSGGPATDRHKDGNPPGSVGGSGGGGGTNDAGGARGKGGSGAQGGTQSSGGNGANAAGGDDDWCAGGGGGGGGFYGGGGGGQGFKVTGKSNDTGIDTYAGGGGGGSSYADTSFTHVFLGGAARPPLAKGNSGTGANGKGGFARITYDLPPKVKWKSAPTSFLESTDFTVEFTYQPARSGGKGIAYYIVGSATDPAATFPTSQSTIMVTDAALTNFTHTFTAPAATETNAYFVQVVDLDGDASAWLKQKVSGLAAASTTPATITSPASGDTFEDSATVNWTVGTQTPLVVYRLGVTGTGADSGVAQGSVTGWRRGGSRVNLATDPGFVTGSVWSSTDNADLVAGDTDFPGVSGSDGKIVWEQTDDGTAENHTVVLDNLKPGTAYRLHLDLASTIGDFRNVKVEVYDDDGYLNGTEVALLFGGPGGYVSADLPFTPNTQGVYVKVTPQAVGTSGDALVVFDFEGPTGDGSTDGITATSGAATADTAQSYQGDYAIKVTGAGTSVAGAAITTVLAADPNADLGFVVQGWAYAPSGAARDAAIRISGAGVVGSSDLMTTTVRDAWVFMRGWFLWDGSSEVDIEFDGDASGIWYDFVEVYVGDFEDEAEYGSTDTGQVTYLANMLIELGTEEDGVDASLPTYFDGSNANGNSGTVSWVGTANASPSKLVDTDIVTGDVAYSGEPLIGGEVFLDTLSIGELVDGYGAARATVAVYANPSTPETPTVTLTVSPATGSIILGIDAADGAAATTTVSFDIFRDDVRIVTGLTPDPTTRLASYQDFPASGTEVTYKVRAWDDQHGYADQTTGTVE